MVRMTENYLKLDYKVTTQKVLKLWWAHCDEMEHEEMTEIGLLSRRVCQLCHMLAKHLALSSTCVAHVSLYVARYR